MRLALCVVATALIVGACGSSTTNRARASSTTVRSAPTTATIVVASTTTTMASATTTSSPTTTVSTQPPAPVLGRAWAPYQQGYGSTRPATIDNGGDPTGLVTSLHWASWGSAEATASGTSTYVGPNQVVAEGREAPVTVVAFDLGACRGVLAYRAVEWFFPQHGGHFDPHTYIDTCTGNYVGSP